MNRLQFFLKATTQYGIHSPFVYRLYSEVLFAPMEKSLLRQLAIDSTDLHHQLIYKLVNKLQPEAIYLLDPDAQAQALVKEANRTTALRIWEKGDSQTIGLGSKTLNGNSPLCSKDENSTSKQATSSLPTDNYLATTSQPSEPNRPKTQNPPQKPSSSELADATPFLVIPHPHKSDFDEFRWNTLRRLNEATATIDLYHSGIIFFNQKLSKQHFLLQK